jgi:hypothetical protein
LRWSSISEKTLAPLLAAMEMEEAVSGRFSPSIAGGNLLSTPSAGGRRGHMNQLGKMRSVHWGAA